MWMASSTETERSSVLSLNPRTRLALSRRRGVAVAVTVSAPRRGRALHVERIERDREPRVFAFLERLCARAGGIDVDLGAAECARLADLGVLATRQEIPRRVRFDCSLLIHPERDAAAERAWQAERSAAAAQFRAERFAPIRGLLHPLQAAALGRYYRDLVAEGYVPLGDEQVARRYYAHNEPIARLVHQQIAGVIGEIAGQPVKPSYVYFASYRPGSVLAAHRDREQCEISVSLLVDYTPAPVAPNRQSSWPLYVECAGRESGFAAVRQSPGEGLLYAGGELTHFRTALPEGHTSTSLFLHYVPLSFDGTLD